MIVIMKENATEKQMKQVIDLVTGAGLTTQTSQDNGKTVIGLIGDTEKLVEAELTALEGVEKKCPHFVVLQTNESFISSREYSG